MAQHLGTYGQFDGATDVAMLRVRHCTHTADESVAICIGVGDWLLEPFVRLFHERVFVRGGAGQNS